MTLKTILISFLGAAGFLAAFQSGVSGSLPPRQPSVNPWIAQLPNVPLTEMVLTQSPQDIDVTVARIGPAGYAGFAAFPNPQETLDPHANVVEHFVSATTAANGNSLQHTITIPGLRIGLYDVRLASRDRTAIQRLTVGTLGLVGNRTSTNSVVMPIDLRTFRKRSDVRLTELFEARPREFVPDRHGLIQFPSPLVGRKNISAPAGRIVATASDGSVVASTIVWSDSAWNPVYFERDRTTYRPGDPVYSRAVARYDDKVVEKSTVLPLSATPGYSDDGIFVADSARSRFVLTAGALTPRIQSGETARFVISATDLLGAPAPELRVRFAWHNLHAAQNDLHYGDVVTDREGNAVISMAAETRDLELYAFDPDGDVAADARVAVAPRATDTVRIYTSFDPMIPHCLPLALSVAGPDGIAKSGQRLHLEVLVESPRATPSPILRRDLKTGNGGYAIVRWCARELGAGRYRITANEPGALNVGSSQFPQVSASPQYGRVEKVLMISPDAAVANPGVPLPMTATSTADGDALVLYGSGFYYHAQTARFSNGIAHFTIVPRAEDDDFKVSIDLATAFHSGRAFTAVTVEPKRHLLGVSIGCTKLNYKTGGTMKLCTHVRDWRRNGEPARLLATVTAATDASLAAAQANAEAPYNTLYTPQIPNLDYILLPNCLACTPVSYLYATPAASQSPAPRQTHALSLATTVEATPEPTRTPLPPQTIFWRSDLFTDKNGDATLTVPLTTAHPGTYLIHVIALTKDHKIGTANAWIHVH